MLCWHTYILIQIVHMIIFYKLEVVGRASETQLQVDNKIFFLI